MDIDWDDLRTVLHLVRGGSLAAAGVTLGINYTTVARRIARIEATLDVILFERLADGYRPTKAALQVAEHAAAMEARELDMLRELQGQDQRLSGKLVLTAPQLMIGPFVAPVIQRFVREHPDVSVELKASNELADLTRREADLAVRISNEPGDTLTGLRIAPQETASFAAPVWAERMAAGCEAPIDWIVYEQYTKVPKAALAKFPNSRVVLTCNDMAAMIGAAVSGLGVVRMPMFLGRHTQGLVQVPALEPQTYMDIWLVGHPDVWRSAKVSAFREMLVPEFKSRRDEFVA
ncbi:LysR family transcriptional regulator [Shimia isoporae]|uniref:LysR family transcriptional regulator n=1 Tax=Shimia isoporae TaxID=647720 RepID=A0A4R1N639_9RHOB|nr:LysR family transcriptional regulator [Shimia isoporae]TCK99995.1 LysR family transcriptional regulator [Shimia isoporae]